MVFTFYPSQNSAMNNLSASFCPSSVEDYQFDLADYNRMAATLMEQLTRTDVIPDMYNKERNIVNRFIHTNVSYKALVTRLYTNL
jgi:hypothetical protein